MNFERSEPFDKQLSRLLAIEIMFEKKIEELRKKLAGNQQFHTRLVFQKMDFKKKGEIKTEDMVYVFSDYNAVVNPQACQNFCRRYTISGAISYDELLKLVAPKTDKALTQRLMMRPVKRGATLPNYLWKYFSEMFVSIISMSTITEKIKKQIQNCSDLSHLEMVEFFKRCLKSPEKLWKFCNSNSDQEYDFSVDDVKYLSNSVRSGNSLTEMTDEDIKEVICPLDMNFQKTFNEMAPYYENLKFEKQRTLNEGFFLQTKINEMASNTHVSFLNMTYQRTMRENNPNNLNAPKVTRKEIRVEEQSYNNIPHVGDNSKMYLDNFIKPSHLSSSRGIELDKFLSGRMARKNFERFDDGLGDNFDSDVDQSGSAFVEY